MKRCILCNRRTHSTKDITKILSQDRITYKCKDSKKCDIRATRKLRNKTSILEVEGV